MMFCDTHCHLFSTYYDDIDLVIEEALASGVNRFIVAGCDTESNQEVLRLVQKYDNVYGCLGIHPECSSYSDADLAFLRTHLSDSKIVGIGEIGLDYHYDIPKDFQKELLVKELDIAKEYDMPVVIHCREATKDMLDILRCYPTVKGVIHSFSLSLCVANDFIKLGYKLGINGVITFKNCHLKDIIKEILPMIVLETDSPYLTPHPYRGSKNYPKYIKDIASFISLCSDISLESLASLTNQNIKEIFKI